MGLNYANHYFKGRYDCQEIIKIGFVLRKKDFCETADFTDFRGFRDNSPLRAMRRLSGHRGKSPGGHRATAVSRFCLAVFWAGRRRAFALILS